MVLWNKCKRIKMDKKACTPFCQFSGMKIPVMKFLLAMKELRNVIKRKFFVLYGYDIWETSSKKLKPLHPVLLFLSEE